MEFEELDLHSCIRNRASNDACLCVAQVNGKALLPAAALLELGLAAARSLAAESAAESALLESTIPMPCFLQSSGRQLLQCSVHLMYDRWHIP